MPTIITEVGTADCRKSAIEVFAELAPGAGILREVDTTAWVGEILNASAKGVFFGIRFIMPTSHTLSDWTLRNCRTNTARGKASPTACKSGLHLLRGISRKCGKRPPPNRPPLPGSRPCRERRSGAGDGAEGGDHSPHFDRLFGGEFISWPQMRRCLCKDVLCQRDRPVEPLEMIGSLAMGERQIIDGLVPRRFQCAIVAVRIAFDRQSECFAVLGKGTRRIAPDRARELVERDDQGQPSVRIVRPVAKFVACSFFSRFGKPGDDLFVRPSTHPPYPVFLVAADIEVRPAPLGKPEVRTAFHSGMSIALVMVAPHSVRQSPLAAAPGNAQAAVAWYRVPPDRVAWRWPGRIPACVNVMGNPAVFDRSEPL